MHFRCEGAPAIRREPARCQKQDRSQILVSLEVEMVPVPPDADRRLALQRLTHSVQRLKPEDREVILAYLEGMEAAEIGELTGISARKSGNQG